MALYAIGDLHLSSSGEKPMDIFGEKWNGHAEKLKKNFENLTDKDTTIICGDLSWGTGISECLSDFKLIDSFPGEKIILKGNHDFWWSTKTKIESFLKQNDISSIRVMHNNSFIYNEWSICGTRGWFYEEETGDSHDKKIMLREIGRLKRSLKSAATDKKLVFLHYPPVYLGYKCYEILELLKDFDAEMCFYGHIHSKAIPYAFNGWIGKCKFQIVSADALDFKPYKIIE